MDLPRSSGVLLHITSLPSPFGIGDLGPSAYRFADVLAEADQQVWQVLPLVPVGKGHSPYASPSTFAGNPLLISPEVLLENGLLQPEDLADRPVFSEEHVDFEQVILYKTTLLRRAFERFETESTQTDQNALTQFHKANADWLDDYALFTALKSAYAEVAWTDWPQPLAQREAQALAQARQKEARSIRFHIFTQFCFHRQWEALHAYCRKRNIRILGDLPIYVAHDSADVWANPDLFLLDATGHPTVVAGVPPDYFSATGQRWGNPIYRWEVMQKRDFAWWTQRLDRALSRCDLLRLDHFRGFAAYWEVPAGEETAINGRWVDAPGRALFEQVEKNVGRLPLLAENLGIITDEVTALMHQLGFPGMAVLQFAFETDADMAFLPHNFTRDLVAYTGTHDNDTLVGWWTQAASTRDVEAEVRERTYARAYLNLNPTDDHEIHWRCIRLLMGSVARLVVTPLQDVLGLGSDARMNTPGTESGNWTWRVRPDQLTAEHIYRLQALTRIYGRSVVKEPMGL